MSQSIIRSRARPALTGRRLASPAVIGVVFADRRGRALVRGGDVDPLRASRRMSEKMRCATRSGQAAFGQLQSYRGGSLNVCFRAWRRGARTTGSGRMRNVRLQADCRLPLLAHSRPAASKTLKLLAPQSGVDRLSEHCGPLRVLSRVPWSSRIGNHRRQLAPPCRRAWMCSADRNPCL